MGCCGSFIKYVLFFLNILFWIAGAAILGIGIWLKVDPNVSTILGADAGGYLHAGAIALIVIGCIIFVIGFCGCCGAIKESKCLLGIYFVFVLLIFIAHVAIGIWAYVSHSSIENIVQKGLNSSVPLVDGSANGDAAVAIQKAFKCCGYVNGCQDWNNSVAIGCSCTTTDSTCAASTVCSNGDASGTNIYQKNCYSAIVDFIKNNINIIAGVTIGIAVAELFLLIATIVVCNSAGKSGYETA